MTDLLFYLLIGFFSLLGLVAIFKKHENENNKFRYIMIATIVAAIVILVIVHTGLFGILF